MLVRAFFSLLTTGEFCTGLVTCSQNPTCCLMTAGIYWASALFPSFSFISKCSLQPPFFHPTSLLSICCSSSCIPSPTPVPILFYEHHFSYSLSFFFCFFLTLTFFCPMYFIFFHLLFITSLEVIVQKNFDDKNHKSVFSPLIYSSSEWSPIFISFLHNPNSEFHFPFKNTITAFKCILNSLHLCLF